MRLCARGSGENIHKLIGAVVLETAILLRRQIMRRAGIRYVISDKRRWRPLRKTEWGC